MHISERDSILEAASKGITFIPLTKSWPADLETPLSTWLKVGEGKPPGVLLESVEGGENRGRYSAIGISPDLIWKSKNGISETAILKEKQ